MSKENFAPKGTMAWRFKCLLIIGEASIHQPETSDWSSYLDLTILSHLKEGKPLVSDIDDSLKKWKLKCIWNRWEMHSASKGPPFFLTRAPSQVTGQARGERGNSLICIFSKWPSASQAELLRSKDNCTKHRIHTLATCSRWCMAPEAQGGAGVQFAYSHTGHLLRLQLGEGQHCVHVMSATCPTWCITLCTAY